MPQSQSGDKDPDAGTSPWHQQGTLLPQLQPIQPNCLSIKNQPWSGSGNPLLVSAGEGEEPLKTRGFQHLGLVASEWLGELEKQNKKVYGMGD